MALRRPHLLSLLRFLFPCLPSRALSAPSLAEQLPPQCPLFYKHCVWMARRAESKRTLTIRLMTSRINCAVAAVLRRRIQRRRTCACRRRMRRIASGLKMREMPRTRRMNRLRFREGAAARRIFKWRENALNGGLRELERGGALRMFRPKRARARLSPPGRRISLIRPWARRCRPKKNGGMRLRFARRRAAN